MASDTTMEPELFYVNSKITDQGRVSQDLFTHWYNDIHIPDILATSGIKRAERYAALDNEFENTERPYLALYPVKFAGYLQSAEFASVPVHSDVLPGPSHDVFDVADFDARCYKVVSSKNPYTDSYVLTIQYEESSPAVEKLLETHNSFLQLKCYFARQNRLAPEESEIGTPPSSLAMFWYPTLDELTSSSDALSKDGVVSRFKLLQRFEAKL